MDALPTSYDDLPDRDWKAMYEQVASTDRSNRHWDEWRTMPIPERRAFVALLLQKLAGLAPADPE